jgi:peptidoglycan/LPS O-acetylase OafA/YrhL
MEPVAVEPFRLGHRRWLDGLRGVAVLMVLAFHLAHLPGGSVGVDIFFVLSGFLITTILAEEWRDRGAIQLSRFYIRRALRLLPAFWLLLAIVSCRIPFLPTPAERTSALWGIVVLGSYFTNWPMLYAADLGGLSHTWSLALEEQFYLLWPIALVLMLRGGFSRRSVVMAVIGGIAFCAVERLVLYRMWKTDGPEQSLYTLRLYTGLDTRADALLVGCLTGLCAVWGFLPTRSDLRMRIAAAAAIFGLGYLSLYRCLDHSQYYHGLFTVAALMTATVIVRLLTAKGRPLLARVLELPPLVAAGKLSYGLYLYHLPVILWLGPGGLGWTGPALIVTTAALTLVFTLLSYFFVERPFLRLKSRFENRAAPVAMPVEWKKAA